MNAGYSWKRAAQGRLKKFLLLFSTFGASWAELQRELRHFCFVSCDFEGARHENHKSHKNNTAQSRSSPTTDAR